MHLLGFAWLALLFGQLLQPGVKLLTVFGTAIWAIFIAEFAARFTLAPAKLRFVKRNWITVLALAVPALRIVGVFAALRFLTVLGGGQVLVMLGALNRTMNSLRVTLGRRKIAFVGLLTLAVMLLGAAGVWRFEPHSTTPGAAAGFDGYWDALWWTAMLMTTIGSAYWPVTPAGRVLAFLLSVYSIGVFGYLTAALASFFIGEDAEDKDAPIAGAGDIAALREEIAKLRREIVARGDVRS